MDDAPALPQMPLHVTPVHHQCSTGARVKTPECDQDAEMSVAELPNFRTLKDAEMKLDPDRPALLVALELGPVARLDVDLIQV